MATLVKLKGKNDETLYPQTTVEGVDGIDKKVVLVTGDSDITGTKNFKGKLKLASKPVLNNLKVFFGVGKSLSDAAGLTKAQFGSVVAYAQPEQASLVPFTFNSARDEATITRDCILHFNLNCKVQGGGSNSTTYSDYTYLHLDKGSSTGSGAGLMMGGIGANTGQTLSLQNIIPLQGTVSFKSGEKFSITSVTRSGRITFVLQLMSGYIEEVYAN